jgi:hypothetical protein
MFLTTALLPNLSTIFYIIALVAFASLTMSLNRHQSQTRRISPFTSITQTIARYVQRRTSLSPTIARYQADSFSPSLAPLPRRQTTHPGLDSKHITQLTSIDIQAALSNHIHSLASTYSRSTYLGYSTFATPSAPALYGRHKRFTDTLYLGMICHIDPTTGSISVRLHADDINTVVQAEWGKLSSSADEVSMLAARDEHDLDIQKQILRAAIGHVCKDAGEEEQDIPSEGENDVKRPQWLLPRYAL